jgi:hypothetical protein
MSIANNQDSLSVIKKYFVRNADDYEYSYDKNYHHVLTAASKLQIKVQHMPKDKPQKMIIQRADWDKMMSTNNTGSNAIKAETANTSAFKPFVAQTPKPNVAQTPKLNVAQTPKLNVAQTPKPNVAQTPKPNVAQTPKPDVAPAPKPNVAQTPKPNVAQTPKPDVAPAPKPNVAQTPKPNVAQAPKPNVAPAPKPDVAQTSKPDVAQTSKPDVVSSPKPNVAPAPKPATDNNVEPQSAFTQGGESEVKVKTTQHNEVDKPSQHNLTKNDDISREEVEKSISDAQLKREDALVRREDAVDKREDAITEREKYVSVKRQQLILEQEKLAEEKKQAIAEHDTIVNKIFENNEKIEHQISAKEKIKKAFEGALSYMNNLKFKELPDWIRKKKK